MSRVGHVEARASRHRTDPAHRRLLRRCTDPACPGIGNILKPAHVKGADDPSETFRVLENKEIRDRGQDRPARSLLQAWDRMIEGGTCATLDLWYAPPNGPISLRR